MGSVQHRNRKRNNRCRVGGAYRAAEGTGSRGRISAMRTLRKRPRRRTIIVTVLSSGRVRTSSILARTLPSLRILRRPVQHSDAWLDSSTDGRPRECRDLEGEERWIVIGEGGERVTADHAGMQHMRYTPHSACRCYNQDNPVARSQVRAGRNSMMAQPNHMPKSTERVTVKEGIYR
jgi:hypothetical protein